MLAKTKIIDALMGGNLTGVEISTQLCVSRQYVCRVAKEIKRKPKSCRLGRPRNCKQEVLD